MNDLEAPDIFLGDDENPQDAFVMFELYEGDEGSIYNRTDRPEFKSRHPKCLVEFTPEKLTVEASNIGTLASDLTVLEYQFIFCTWETHGPADGFIYGIHSGEATGDPLEDLASAAAIPPGGKHRFSIQVPRFNHPFRLWNIYFRGRLATLWSKPPDPDDWDFSRDPRVTEAHLRIT